MESTDGILQDLTHAQALEHIRQLTARNEELSHDLEDCREQLFELLQKENDISEQAIGDAFNRIFEGIDSWIDDISSFGGFEENFKASYQENLTRDRDGKFRYLGLHSACRGIEWVAGRLGNLETCRYVVLSLAVSRCLAEYVFRVHQAQEWGAIFPLGIPDHDISLLVEVQSAMASDALKKDPMQISRWRGEAVTALMATKRIQESAVRAAARVRRHLQEDISIWVGRETAEKHLESLQTKVLDRAIHAVDLIGRSNKTFMFVGEDVRPGPIPKVHAASNVKDMAIWRNVPSSDALGAIRCLYPGLARKGEPGKKGLTLSQPTLLGYRSPELQPNLTSSSRGTSPSKQELRRLDREPSDTSVSARSPRISRKKSPPKHLCRPPDAKPAPPPKDLRPSLISKLAQFAAPTSPAPEPKGTAKSPHRRGSRSKVPTGGATDPHRNTGSGSPTREQDGAPLPPPQVLPHDYASLSNPAFDPDYDGYFLEHHSTEPLYQEPQQWEWEDSQHLREIRRPGGGGHRTQ